MVVCANVAKTGMEMVLAGLCFLRKKMKIYDTFGVQGYCHYC